MTTAAVRPETTVVYATIGARGGRSTSAAKAAAARENGRRGGRPKGAKPKQVKTRAFAAFHSPVKEPKRVSVRGLAQRIDRVLAKKRQYLRSCKGFFVFNRDPIPMTPEESARSSAGERIFRRHGSERVADIEGLGRELGVLKPAERLA